MNGPISQTAWRGIVSIWMCVETGQFVETRISWGQDGLFWPFWICLTLVIVLGVQLLDAQYTNQRQPTLHQRTDGNSTETRSG